MAALLTGMISMILYLILLLDHPFTGTAGISPNAFMRVIAMMETGLR